MAQSYKDSASESTVTNSQQNAAFYAKDTKQDMQWEPEQIEILQDEHEKQIANEQYLESLPEPHRILCNCPECN